MQKVINIGVTEDHLLMRQGMIALLKDFPEINILFDVSNGRELMDALKIHKPDIILLDIEMPVMSGREAFERITFKYPKIKFIIISTHFKDSYIIEFLKKGANSFLNKNSSVEKIVAAIKAVDKFGTYYDPAVQQIMSTITSKSILPEPEAINSDSDLTSREMEIIRLICKNQSNKEISDELGISVRTVEGHRLNIMRKTKCKTVLELTAFAFKNNLISVP